MYFKRLNAILKIVRSTFRIVLTVRSSVMRNYAISKFQTIKISKKISSLIAGWDRSRNLDQEPNG